MFAKRMGMDSPSFDLDARQQVGPNTLRTGVVAEVTGIQAMLSADPGRRVF